jgi:tRNA threonylcarbamoyladenosine biosynthesis protein TsaB
MEPSYSIAIETSCRAGGVALGRGDELLKAVRFDASYRQGAQLVARMDELLRSAGIGSGDLAELYVSTGPGGFTGLRLGITVARTMAQSLPALRVTAVPTIRAVAENARDLDWRRLGVALDYKDGQVYAGLFNRALQCPGVPRATSCIPADAPYGEIVSAGEPALAGPEEFLARAPRPLLLVGEAMELVKMEAEGVSHAPADLNLPTPEGVWRVGRRLAAGGTFTDFRQLLPLYTRKPEAVRLWEKRNTV